MFNELIVLRLRQFPVIVRHTFSFPFLGFPIIDIGLDDLHIGHDVYHLTLAQHPFGNKAFVLVSTTAHKDKKQEYQY